MTDEDQVLVQRVRFTGERTRLPSMVVKGYGRVYVGQVIEVTAEQAERYTADLPMRSGVGSDFVKVGGEFAVATSELASRRYAIRDRLDADSRDDEPAVEESTEADADEPAEQPAEEATDEPEPDKPAAPKRGRAKR